jgi:uncharacterized phage protein gp47/JayE
MAGLTSTGITIKDVAEILADIESEQLANIDPDLSVAPDDVLGQLNGIYAAALAELWELVEEVYQSAYPDTASGQSLSYVSALTGAIRQEATKAELDVRLVGTASATVPAGTRGYVDGDPDSLWETTADAEIAEEGGFDYIDVTMEAVTAGTATTAYGSDSQLVIATPVSGLDYIAIQFDYNPGVDEETDSDLRIRREQSLAQAGSSTVSAIRSDMLDVEGVDTCTVFENPTGDTDINGVPPYAIEVLVFSEAAPSYTDQAIADQIFASKPAGTEAYGLDGPHTVTDTQGNDHEIYFSEPTTVQVHVKFTLTAATDGTYLGDGAVADAVAAWASAELLVGGSVYQSDIASVVTNLEGVISVGLSSVRVEDQDPPTTYDHAVTARQLATIASEDVDVTS